MKRREFLSAVAASSTGAGLLSAAEENSASEQNSTENAYARQTTTGVEPETATPYDHDDDPDRYDLSLHLQGPDGEPVTAEKVCLEQLAPLDTTETPTAQEVYDETCLAPQSDVADFYFSEEAPGQYGVTVYRDDRTDSIEFALEEDTEIDLHYEPDEAVYSVVQTEPSTTTASGVTTTTEAPEA